MTTLKTRHLQKRGTYADWEKAVNFVPLRGEIIVYELWCLECTRNVNITFSTDIRTCFCIIQHTDFKTFLSVKSIHCQCP